MTKMITISFHTSRQYCFVAHTVVILIVTLNAKAL